MFGESVSNSVETRSLFNRLFIAHPQSIGESYFEHQRIAFSFVGPLLFAGFACLLHAVIPGFCEHSASTRIKDLHRRIVAERGNSSHRPAARSS